MFGRWRDRRPEQERLPGPPTERPRIGIGALVLVLDEPGAADRWQGEPSGVVVGRGQGDIVGYPGLRLGGGASWLVAFDELAWTSDGRGPFERASIPASMLVPVPTEEGGGDTGPRY